MRIGMTGASGFIGNHLTEYMTRLNHQIVPIGRRLLREESFQQLVETVEDCDVLINLAGATINQRWTPEYKYVMCDSRIGTTARLVSAIQSAERKPKLMISASAVGYYPTEGEFDEHDEVAVEGFLATPCRDWETEAKKCPPDTRLVITRFGVVLAIDGGAMQEMIKPLIRTKVSAILGSGRQAFPWISIEDVCKAMHFLIDKEAAKGVYNFVSPQQITQGHLAHELSKAYGAWATLPVPGLLFQCLFGERSSMLLEGQRVRPSRLLEVGYEFSVPTVEKLLNTENTRH